LQAALLADIGRLTDLLAASQGKLAGSEAAGREVLASAHLLAATESNDAKRDVELARRLKQLGDLSAADADETRALLFYREALPIARRRLAASPSDRESLVTLALILDKVGEMRKADPQGALAASLEQLGLNRRLVELEPQEALWRLSLALVLVKVAAQSEDRTRYVEEARGLLRGLEDKRSDPAFLPWILVIERFLANPKGED